MKRLKKALKGKAKEVKQAIASEVKEEFNPNLVTLDFNLQLSFKQEVSQEQMLEIRATAQAFLEEMLDDAKRDLGVMTLGENASYNFTGDANVGGIRFHCQKKA